MATETTGLADSTLPPRRISIGTITRNRPLWLERLLGSYLEMSVPENVVLRFVIVENADTASLGDIVERFRRRAGDHEVHYTIEPRLGIASARNCVLDYARDVGDDLLVFADDDEFVTKDWLVNLLAERDRSELALLSSPVRFEPPSAEASRWQKFIWSGLNRTNLHNEAKAFEKWKNKEAARIIAATGSWMGDLQFFRDTALRFDDSLGMAGGEDWKLWVEARRLGAKTGWAPDAIVYETVPLGRLSLRYQYRRARDTSMTLFGAKLKAKRGPTLAKLPGSVLGRILTLLIAIVAVPFTSGSSLVKVAISAGNVIGVFHACMGTKSSHYK